MATTIQINQETLLMLRRLKEQFQAESYEGVIRKMIAERSSNSLAGFLGKKKRADIMKDLRDKNDRQ